MSQDKQLVLQYLSAWIIVFLLYYRKRRKFDAGCFIITSYILYAISSYLLYNTSYINFKPLPLELFPFVYLFLMLLVGLMPILKFNSDSKIEIQQPRIALLNVFSLIFIFSTLIQFPSSVNNIIDGLNMIMNSYSGGQDLYEESISLGENSGHAISNLAAVVSNAFAQLGFLLTIYYLSLENKNKLIVIGLFFSCVMKMLNGIALAQRGAIVEPLLVLFATFFLLKGHIQPFYKKVVSMVGAILIFLLSIPFIYITISRFDNKVYDPLESTYYYLGIENINFNNYALDDNGIRYGDRVIPLFKVMAGFDDVPKNFYERRDKYPNLRINDNSFITYVGDIAIDFGPYFAVLLICFFSFFIVRKTRLNKGKYKFHQLLLIHFWIYLCVLGGLKLFPFADVGGNLKIIVLIVTYLIFKYDFLKTNKRI